jgi:type III restriction enzyme
VTPTTAKLLSHWRSYEFEGLRPFFCQVEAVETMIWLTEVARGRRQYAHIWKHLEAANEQANPELFRLAMKMATGAGKTTVMAMLIAWQTANAVRSPGSSLFSKGFLIVTPGITIRDRLRVLLPSDPENYYETRNLVPPDMVGDVRKAKVEIVNYHVFKRRETDGTNKVSRGIRAGWRNEPSASIHLGACSTDRARSRAPRGGPDLRCDVTPRTCRSRGRHRFRHNGECRGRR